MTTLAVGIYKLPSNCVINVCNGNLSVIERKSHLTSKLRCKDCLHYKQGYHSKRQLTPMFICDARTKNNGFHYAAMPHGKICEKFEQYEII